MYGVVALVLVVRVPLLSSPSVKSSRKGLPHWETSPPATALNTLLGSAYWASVRAMA